MGETEGNTLGLFADAIDMIEAAKAITNLAALVATMREGLIDNGFSRSEALELCSAWLAALTMRGAKG